MYLQKLPKQNISRNRWKPTKEKSEVSIRESGWMKKAKNRPVAVMTENTHVTLPQYGIGNADIIYECPVEGGITRLMTIYQDYASLKKVGNVRSCRLYYVYFAKEFEAVYFHAGESKYALDVLNSSFIDNVDGITGKGGAFITRTIAAGHRTICIQPEKI